MQFYKLHDTTVLRVDGVVQEEGWIGQCSAVNADRSVQRTICIPGHGVSWMSLQYSLLQSHQSCIGSSLTYPWRQETSVIKSHLSKQCHAQQLLCLSSLALLPSCVYSGALSQCVSPSSPPIVPFLSVSPVPHGSPSFLMCYITFLNFIKST